MHLTFHEGPARNWPLKSGEIHTPRLADAPGFIQNYGGIYNFGNRGQQFPARPEAVPGRKNPCLGQGFQPS
jgi:hypothetical protein